MKDTFVVSAVGSQPWYVPIFNFVLLPSNLNSFASVLVIIEIWLPGSGSPYPDHVRLFTSIKTGTMGSKVVSSSSPWDTVPLNGFVEEG